MIYVELLVLLFPMILVSLSYMSVVNVCTAICLYSLSSGALALVVVCILVKKTGIIEGGVFPKGEIFFTDSAVSYISSIFAIGLYVVAYEVIDSIFDSKKA